MTTQEPDADPTAKVLASYVIQLTAIIKVYDHSRNNYDARTDRLIDIVGKLVDVDHFTRD